MQNVQSIGIQTKELLRSAIIWDNHGCMPFKAYEAFLPQLERYRTAGVNVVSINIGYADMSWADHLRAVSCMRQWIAQQPNDYCLLTTVEDVYRSKADGKLGVVFDIEGMYPVQDDLNLVQTFYELGVRWMLVAYNRNNAAGGGCLDRDGGLTAIGRRVIDEMERVGMVLCVSHTGHRTASEALEYARNPVILSHSNPYGDTPHVRNVSDDLIRACARKGGVIGLSGLGPFLGANVDLAKRLAHQLLYTIDLVGAEHVGLGLDYVFDCAGFDENVRLKPNLYPPGFGEGVAMVEPEAIQAVAEELAHHNLSDGHIRGVLGENWLRIARLVWR
jgi:membrane dipeptidase